jgi:ubiquinone/menaquinone biosynthesis C-methylase UbiE
MKKEPFIAYEAYKKLAKKYAEIIDTKPHNAEYERPGLLKLMPDVKGKHVLDAGCGTGSLTRWLLDHGANVIAVDASPHMLEEAFKRLGDNADIRLHDLRYPLDFIEGEYMDIVASSLVVHYIENIKTVFQEFYRVLKPGGQLVFSFQHPFTDFHYRPTESYYDVIMVKYDWTGFTEEPVTVPGYRRPLQGYTEALRESGFIIQRLTEPKPTEHFREQEPDSYERHMKNPLFMVILAKKS